MPFYTRRPGAVEPFPAEPSPKECDPSSRDTEGWTALDWAISQGQGGGVELPKEVFFVWKNHDPWGFMMQFDWLAHMFQMFRWKTTNYFFRSVKKNKAHQVRWFLTLKCPSLCNLVFLMPLNFKDPIITTEQTRRPWLLCFRMWICFTSFTGKNHRNPLTQKGHPIVRLGRECTTRSLTGCSGWYKWM